MKKKVVEQPSPRTLACRINARKGGLARAKNCTPEKIMEWGSKGGQATLDKHSNEFFRFASKQRKVVGRYRTPAGGV